MNEKDLEIQRLTRENIELKKRIEELERIRQLDMSEIVFQRRQIDFLMEGHSGNNKPN